ncbi:cytochrome-c peroxidase [Aquimarina agarivorans]|uniref:cytochrome-c peroxidase n=1 Tax=Aquimarina agarivorans TaxID=980584 RepID=UPI001EE67784|nr:cytochrome c peroxidase [Aquimarina agarivorans]
MCLLFAFVGCKKKPQNDENLEAFVVTPLKQLESTYKEHLKNSFEYLEKMQEEKNPEKMVDQYKLARAYFKRAEPILSFIDKNNYASLNAPNLLKVLEEDATDIKIIDPIGFQVIEELLFEEKKDLEQLKIVTRKTSNRLKLLYNNTKLRLKDYHILWIIRNQIVRIATAGITGFDSPVLAQSLSESAWTYKEIINILDIYESNFSEKNLLHEWKKEIEAITQSLDHDYDTFDRFSFIKNHLNKQLVLMNKTQKDWEVNFNVTLALNHTASHLFSEDAFNMKFFSDYRLEANNLETKVAIGKKLFNDKRLSLNNDMACATCHIQKKAFTDGKKTFSKNQKRNTPTITYSALQKAYFYDARAGSLEGQIVGVVKNHGEFNTSLEHLVKVVTEDSYYNKAFDTLYTRGATDMNIRHTMASYIKTLNKFNSKFDRNIRGEENTLTASEKNGFNLFMGKALCATCHFAPVFNGTVPPNLSDTELEAIGVPVKNDTMNAKIAADLGRYYLFNTPERKHFFKTPTVRNAALTAPYMHNGVYNTLEEVVDFYNRGGGKGIGINLPNQTLPFDNLNLTKSEQKDLVAFIKTLSDEDFL